jgi:uncharacterized OB-fold protein
MEEQKRQAWYRYFEDKYNIPQEYLTREFEDELSGKNPLDAPLEIPDKMEVVFKYSYGGQSRFFRELRENKVILGAKCPDCGKVFCPPRAHCHQCYEPTEWVELKGTGTVKACTVQYYTTSVFIKKLPFICAYVRLDGTDTLLMTNMEVDDVSAVREGTKVRAVFREERHGLITDFYFVVDE